MGVQVILSITECTKKGPISETFIVLKLRVL